LTLTRLKESQLKMKSEIQIKSNENFENES